MTNYKYYTGTSIKATTGLVAAYNMVPNGSTLVDISGNGKNFNTNTGLSTKNGIKYSSLNENTAGTPDWGNVRTIAMRVKLDSTTEKILEGAANDKFIYANAGTLNYADFDNVYVNGIDTDTIVAGQWLNIVILSSTDVNMSAVSLALNNTTYGDVEFEDLMVSNSEWSIDRIKDYHNSFIKPYLIETMDNHPVGETAPKGWVKGTGNYEVKELTSQDSVLKDLNTGTKYLENTSNGVAAIQSKQAYGEWTFDVYKGGNYPEINIISQTKNNRGTGYFIQLREDSKSLLLAKSPGLNALFVTDTSYISNNTWYRIKVARLKSEGTFANIVSSMTTTYPADTFAVFIKGGEFGNEYTLVDTTGGLGSNPVTDSTYTISEYLVTDLDVGDKITNIKLLNGVKQ